MGRPYFSEINLNGVDQIVDGFSAVFFRYIGDMGVPSCRCGAGMAKKGLDMAEA